MGPDKPKILFLSLNNSCTGQMAEGWGQHLLADRFAFFSAGVRSMGVDLFAVKVMKEAGIDISYHQSKRLGDVSEHYFDLVVILCDQISDDFVGLRRGTIFRWNLTASSDADFLKESSALQYYRDLRDEIRALVESLSALEERR